MGMSRATNSLGNPKDSLGVEEESFSTAQEAVPVPFLVGKRKVAPIWITRVINQRAQPAPQERPGKK